MTRRARPFGDFLLCLFGPIVWVAHFFVMYGAATLVCTGRPVAYAMIGIGIVATTVALASLGAFVVWKIRERLNRRGRPNDIVRFLNDLSLALATISMLAILAVAWPVLHLPTCVSPFG